ncbi:MAG: glycosyltransferase family 4 protein [Bacteroidales bacterium]|nr:glycosyltransferase family 4 protein [Bacteroidales bacterium]
MTDNLSQVIVTAAYIIVFIFSFFLTMLFRGWAIRKSLLDHPTERSSHSKPVPRGGGLVIVITFYTAVLAFYLIGKIDITLFLGLLPGIPLAIIGFLDDIKKINWLIRLVAQFICSGLALYLIGGLQPLFGTDYILIWSIIAVIGSVWFINIFNFLDGSDGYASMEAISISMAVFFFTGESVALIIALSVGGFLYWNWPRAKVFLGDSGSTTLGYILVIVGVFFHNTSVLDFPFWIIITTLFWFDASATLIRRMFNRENISQPHRKHMYQRLIRGGFSHLSTLLIGLTINIILFLLCIAVKMSFFSVIVALMVSVSLHVTAFVILEKIFPYTPYE